MSNPYNERDLIERMDDAQISEDPVAWLYEREDGAGVLSFEKNLRLILKGYKEIPLYTHEGNANDNS